MAEFQKVMREWKRMCKSRGNIPDDFVDAGSALLFAFDRPDEIERLVMEWAAEHPEPEYPTWVEYLVGIGVIPHEIRLETADALMDTHLLKPISADIAEKLGIEPKEGT
jgi:hypothetical protein